MQEQGTAHLLGGVHRDVTGRASDPLAFYLTINRGLRSGRVDEVPVDEDDLLRLVIEAAQALALLRRERKP